MAESDIINSFLADTEELYFSQCTQISQSQFSDAGQADYQPDSREYFEDVAHDRFMPGLVLASASFLIAFVSLIWSCILCCVRPRVAEESELEKVKNSHNRTSSRCVSFVVVSLVIGLTLLVIAMGAWGIFVTEDKVKVVVPRSFLLVKNTEAELGRIHSNLSTVIDNTRVVVEQLGALGVNSPSIDLARDALSTAQGVLENNIDVYRDKTQDVLGYRDESDKADKALRGILIGSFLLMIIMALLVCLFVVFMRQPWGTLTTIILMWFLLVLAFGFGVGFTAVARELTEDTCLYVNGFAIEEIEKAVSPGFRNRVEPILRYYFVAPDGVNRSEEDLQVLWDLPLDDFRQALDEAVDDLGQEIPEITAARGAVEFVATIITGITWRLLHKDLIDLICCTVYDAVDSIWIAWVCAAAAAFVLAVIGTFQVIKAVWVNRPPTRPPPTVKEMKPSSYAQDKKIGAVRKA